MTTRKEQQTIVIAGQVADYACEYDCTLIESLEDWEGYGPGGSFGLTLEDKQAVTKVLQGRGLSMFELF